MNKKKILLINPPQTYYKESSDFNAYFPIGLLYVASLIKNLGNVKIFDCLVEEFKTTEIKDGNIYGTSYYRLEKEIRKFKPQIIGITIPFSCQLNNALKVARLCKRINSKAIVVVGGPDPSIRGKKILEKNKSIDICVLGEGEYTFLEIVKNYRNYQIQQISSIAGILYKNSEGRVIKNKSREYIKELDKLPFPAYNLIDFDKYFSHPFLYANRSAINKKSMSVFTSRGCPFNCIFCSIHLHMGKRYRAHSPEYVIRHLKLLIEKYKIKNFHFEDDNVSLDKKRFEKILDLIIKNNLRISWDTPNGIRADTLTYNLLKKIKKSGCTDLRIAIESGDQRILNDVVKKNLDLNYVLKVIKWAHSLKLHLKAFYIIGFPGEKKRDMFKTIKMALSLYKKYKVEPCLMIANPLYGTRLYNMCSENNLFTKSVSDRALSEGTQIHGKHLIKTKDFNEKDLDSLVAYFDKHYFNRPKSQKINLKRIILKLLFARSY